MTITIDIAKSVTLGNRPSTAVNVTALNAASDEMPFVAALTKAVKEFTESFKIAKEDAK